MVKSLTGKLNPWPFGVVMKGIVRSGVVIKGIVRSVCESHCHHPFNYILGSQKGGSTLVPKSSKFVLAAWNRGLKLVQSLLSPLVCVTKRVRNLCLACLNDVARIATKSYMQLLLKVTFPPCCPRDTNALHSLPYPPTPISCKIHLRALPLS